MEKDFRLYLIAKMYYVDRMRQNDIAKEMGISNMMVSRLLKRAEDEEIVTFHVHSPNKINWEIGKRIKDRYPNLKEVIVVVPDADENPRTMVGRAAAGYIQELASSGSNIGISWGLTILECINALKDSELPDIKMLQMSGGFLCEDSYEMMPSNMVKLASEKLHAIPLFLNAPMFVASAEIKRSLLADPLLQYLEAQFNKMQITVYGISNIRQATTMKKVGILSKGDIEELQAKGAVGDVMGYFLNSDGEIVEWSKSPCYMGPSLETVAKAPHAVCLATGTDKAQILRLAITRRYCNTLVISYDLACELLQE